MTTPEWDLALFLFINKTISFGFLDTFFMGLTVIGHKPWMLAPLWFLIYFKGGPSGKIIAWLIIPLLLFSDMIPTYGLKPYFARPRPFMVIEGVNLLIADASRVSPYGFPSNHASNIFALATFLSLCYKKKWIRSLTISVAVLVGLSRVYVGVHYPTDVLAGAVYGGVLALFFYSFSILIKNYKNPRYT